MSGGGTQNAHGVSCRREYSAPLCLERDHNRIAHRSKYRVGEKDDASSALLGKPGQAKLKGKHESIAAATAAPNSLHLGVPDSTRHAPIRYAVHPSHDNMPVH